MITLFVLLGVTLALLALSMWRSSRRQRAVEERRNRQAEAARQGGGDPLGPGGSPFGVFPFGGLFGSLLSGPGGWSRSLAYDPETGRWVDITDRETAPEEAEAAGGEDETPAERRRRRARRRTSQPQQANPLGSLFGGGMGGMGSGGNFDVEPADELEGFEGVGGMEPLKRELQDTVGLMLEHPDEAERYGIEWNGILLHGPPGVGKTFFARAIAGEYDLNLMHVSTGDLVSSLQGGSAQNIDKAFDTALRNLPCLLFFDEFDSIAQRRDNTPEQESRRTVNQLLTSLEAHRDERELVVMAATNSIEHLDPAVIRPGRFDRHIRIDLPDEQAREAIVRAELDDRPTAGRVETAEFVRRAEGLTPAAIEKVIDAAALDVFREATRTGQSLELTTENLLAALERHGGEDRPMIEHWNWDSLILPANIKAQLQQLQSVIEDPESARRFGVDPPTGLLLAGPPGTGKTTVAKVLAAQARCSFYPVSGADVMSKWVGESEQKVRQLFERARANRPSIVFIDEIDAIAGRRGQVEVHDSHVNQLLSEIDGISGQRGVFIVGATNRPDQLDPALMRGGRLSRTIVLGLPDEEGRLAMLRLHSARMPTVGVRLEEIADRAQGMSPADLKALCQEAALAAMTRHGAGAGNGAGQPAVCHEDFEEALERLRADRSPLATST
ncbi:MAG TPA: AAA family ATPase [Solirubrobacterales bacterium]|jgi:transitional endoplasmic reticulum ATPase|nr:AAA family ATPase [Solirubrobacterales bacterium]